MSLISNLGEQLVLKNLDSLKKIDRRSLRSLTRMGLVVEYPDGTYSLTPRGMKEAISDWEDALMEAEKYNPRRAQELKTLIQKAPAWIARHQTVPEGKFGDLTGAQYYELWKVVTQPIQLLGGSTSKSKQVPKKIGLTLIKRGYAIEKPKGALEATDKGRAMIRQHGSPGKQASTAERVAERHASTKVDGILRRIKKIPRVQVETEEKLSGKGNLMWTVYTAKLPGSNVTLTFKDDGKGGIRGDFQINPGKGPLLHHRTLKDALEDFQDITEND